MKVTVRGVGVVDVTEEQIIKLEEGFFGFEEYHEFALIDSDVQPFFWVASVTEGGPTFVVIDPFIFRPDYEIDLNDDVLRKLELKSPTDALIFALVTMSKPEIPPTANLQGPLIINKINKKAMQVIAGGSWKTKHDIIAELESKEKK
ncbi:MAG: flagellar assembly protein FliW [Treponema sp.]